MYVPGWVCIPGMHSVLAACHVTLLTSWEPADCKTFFWPHAFCWCFTEHDSDALTSKPVCPARVKWGSI